MLRKLGLAVLVWFVSLPVFGQQVKIPQECRVRNKTGIQCVWASIETLARHHGVPAASNLTDYYKGLAGPNDALRVLRERRVQGYITYPGFKNVQWLKDCCSKGWGAGVGLGGQHMLLVVHYKDGQVGIIDNLDPELRVKYWTEPEFLNRWDGWTVTLVPPVRVKK